MQFKKPNTNYTRSGRINIAYQCFGEGPVDLVYIPGWVSNIDLMWSCPELVHFLTTLSRLARIILFDKRGTGLSDRVVELSTIEERMDDIRAVMDAVGSEKAILFGHSEGGSASALFAATYPNRTIALITFGVFAKRRYAPDYPWAPTDAERQKVYDMIENSWGSGAMHLETLAPSKASDHIFMEWLANYFRSGASPSAALVLTKMNTDVDIIGILGSIRVPTLLMQRTNDIDVKIEEGRFIAERIKGARFVEFDGNDHLFWAGNTQEVLDEMERFISRLQIKDHHQVQLLTVAEICFKALPADKEVFSHLEFSSLEDLIKRYRGQIVSYSESNILATFEGPSKAVHCALDVLTKLSDHSVIAGVCVHIGECRVKDGLPMLDEVSTIVAGISDQLFSRQVLVSQTVKNLLSGSGLQFKNAGSMTRMNGGVLDLFSVHDELMMENSPKVRPERKIVNDSFLENVLQCIENNISNEFFGVENLCKDLGIGERQLQRKLKSVSNKTPNQMIRSVRLHFAKQLIQSQNKNISEAAFQTGFSNLSYFTKCFKEEFGTLPSMLF